MDEKSAKVWQGNVYYTKRGIEIVLLAPIECNEKDLDACLHRWPLGPGTQGGLKLIFPSVTATMCREGIRMLQRALGRGQRSVPVTFLHSIERPRCGDQATADVVLTDALLTSTSVMRRERLRGGWSLKHGSAELRCAALKRVSASCWGSLGRSLASAETLLPP